MSLAIADEDLRRGLTIYRPWDHAMFHGDKHLENRTWKPWPEILGRLIVIHAGLTFDDEDAVRFIEAAGHKLPDRATLNETAGRIVGVVRVVRAFVRDRENDSLPLEPLSRNKWCIGPWCWVLEDVTALPRPITHVGARGLWPISGTLRSQIIEQLREGQERVAGVCRVCGCTDDRACEGGCSWVEPSLCSACLDPGLIAYDDLENT